MRAPRPSRRRLLGSVAALALGAAAPVAAQAAAPVFEAEAHGARGDGSGD
ncbi:MAG: hypothetical protein INR64_10090, partial [Caulobacteraceae bacterium]|nr:hypothetical protein [Caulobacter sp.]